MLKKDTYQGCERREFIRLDCVTPLAYKVCKEETIHKLLEGYTSNISPAGILCNMKDKVNKDDILWLSFDRGALSICRDLEKRSFIYQNGVIGKVVRIEHKNDGTYDTGVRFITREEKNLTNIYPKIQFMKEGQQEEQGERGQDEETLEGIEAPDKNGREPEEEKRQDYSNNEEA